MLKVHPYEFLFVKEGSLDTSVTVCISLYNYQNYIIETLQSVFEQTLSNIDLIVVEDQSTDQSLAIAKDWLSLNTARFNRVHLIQHLNNQGLSAARNTAISVAQTPFIFILDADNLLYPRCLSRCIEALQSDPQASVAYPIIEKFDGDQALIGNVVWDKEHFKKENCIDAMSLIRKQDLLSVEGYSELSAVGILGWEDYELWCKFIDIGFYGVPVSEILARYRTHVTSMLNSISNRRENIEQIHHEMMDLHPWLELNLS